MPKLTPRIVSLLLAVFRGHEAVVQQLLATGKVDVSTIDKNGQTLQQENIGTKI
jgi:hypothetical protein